MTRNMLVGTLILAVVLASSASGQRSLTWRTNAYGEWITTTAHPMDLSDDGEGDMITTVGNVVFPPGMVRIGSNGAVRFAGPGTDLYYVNQPLPSADNFSLDSQVLDPFWDDIDTDGGVNGNICCDDWAGTFVVSWDEVEFYDDTDPVWFQLQVHATGPAFAQFHYEQIETERADGGVSATIGYQDGGVGFGDAQWSFDRAMAVQNGTILSLVCLADLDGNARVNLADLAALLANYGMSSGAWYQDGDLEPHPDGDGDVDLGDLATLLSLYDTSCP